MKRLMSLLVAVALLWSAAAATVPGRSLAVSAATARFVAGFEGFLPCVYADPAGHATIGYGHLIHLGPPTRKDAKRWGCLTRNQALKLLRKDLRATELEVLARIRGSRINAPMLTALESFAFNLGAGALDRQKHRGSGKFTAIAANVRRGRYDLAGRQMLLYDGAIIHGKRRELPGLVIRRRKEYRMLMRGARTLGRSCASGCVPGNPGDTGTPGAGGGITVG